MRKKILILILAIAMLISSIPVSAIANSIRQPISNNSTNGVFVVGEDYSKRSEFEKHYICSDGTYMAVSYPEAVHYKDDGGNWVDVNNTFTLNCVQMIRNS